MPPLRITCRDFFAQINVSSIIIMIYDSQAQSAFASYHPVVAFLVPILISLLQLKYHGTYTSPFETHPKSMGVSFVCLILYCLAYNAEQRQLNPSDNAWFVHRGTVFFGSLSAASMASTIHLPDSVGPLLCVVWLLFTARDQLLKLLKWVVHCKISAPAFPRRGPILPL